jgi:hypothetical protein
MSSSSSSSSSAHSESSDSKRRKISSSSSSVADASGDELHFLSGCLTPVFDQLAEDGSWDAALRVKKVNLMYEILELSSQELIRKDIPLRLHREITSYHARECHAYLSDAPSPSSSSVDLKKERMPVEMNALLNQLQIYMKQCNVYLTEVRELFLLLRTLGDAKCLCGEVDVSGEDIIKWKSLRMEAVNWLDRYAMKEKECFELNHFLKPARMGMMESYKRGLFVKIVSNFLYSSQQLILIKNDVVHALAACLQHLRLFVK